MEISKKIVAISCLGIFIIGVYVRAFQGVVQRKSIFPDRSGVHTFEQTETIKTGYFHLLFGLALSVAIGLIAKFWDGDED
jgi:hypothetical protein